MTHLVGEVAPAPLIPAGVLYGVGLIAFLGFLVATGMLKAYAASIGYLIRWLAQNINVSIPIPFTHGIHPFGALAGGLEALDSTIRNGLADLALSGEKAAAWSFSTAGEILHWTGKEIAALWDGLIGTVVHTATVAIPHALADAERRALEQLHRLGLGIDTLRRDLGVELHRLHLGIDRVAGRLTGSIAHALDWAKARVGVLERDLIRTERRVGRVEKALVGAAFAAAVAVALDRLIGRWWRCGALKRVGRQVGCGGFGFLEALLALEWDTLIMTDLCQIVRLETLAVTALRSEAEAFFAGLDATACLGRRAIPPRLPLAQAALPPVLGPAQV